MTINKFGSHLFSKDETNNVKIVDIAEVTLSYIMILPFIGRYIPTEKNFVLMQDGRTSYRFPFEKGIILFGEYPKKDVSMLVNGKAGKLENRSIKKGDLIAFRRETDSKLTEFYGELQIKCPVVIEK